MLLANNSTTKRYDSYWRAYIVELLIIKSNMSLYSRIINY